jgi:hypothetical protein
MIDVSTLRLTEIPRITVIVGDGSHPFQISGTLLLDFEGISILRYLMPDSNVTTNHDIEITN